MKKRGQFYLIAAIVIVIVILSLSQITNYLVSKKEPLKFYDLSEELNEEGARVIDYGVYNSQNIQAIIQDYLANYFINYSKEKESETKFLFLYGDRNLVTAITYSRESTGEISIVWGGGSFTLEATANYVPDSNTFTPTADGKVSMTLLNNTYEFDLKEKGQNFFFVIARDAETEKHIKRSPIIPDIALNLIKRGENENAQRE